MSRKRRYLVGMLVLPLLIPGAVYGRAWLLSQEDPDGHLIFARLSREIHAHPEQQVLTMARIPNMRGYVIGKTWGRIWGDPSCEYVIVYDRLKRTLNEDAAANWSQSWGHVTDAAIDAVAAEHGTYENLDKHGCKNIHP